MNPASKQLTYLYFKLFWTSKNSHKDYNSSPIGDAQIGSLSCTAVGQSNFQFIIPVHNLHLHFAWK